MQIDNQSLAKSLPFLKAGRAARSAAGSTSNFLLEPTGNGLMLTCSNQVSETTCRVQATNVTKDAITLPPEFAEIVERGPDAPIVLKLTAKRMDVSIGKAKAKLPILPGDSFPRLEPGAAGDSFTMESASLRKALAETLAFAPTNDPRLFLNGVLLNLANNRVTCVATNGHIISVSLAPATMSSQTAIEKIIPVQAARQLAKVLENDKDVQITVSENALQFSCGNTALKVKPIQGAFPNWSKLLKAAPPKTFAFTRRALQEALERASIFADSKVPVAAFKAAGQAIDVCSASKDSGESNDSIEIDAPIDGQAKQFHARIDYVTLACSSLGSDRLRVSYFDEDLTPLWFRKADADDCVIIVTPYKS